MGRYAVIDIGTNSVKIHAARVVHGRTTPLLEAMEVTRLGEGLRPGGELDERARERTLAAVKRLAERAAELGVETVAAVGTEAFRSAADADDFVKELRRRAKVSVTVLDGAEEARLAAVAIRGGLALPAGATLGADVGGGSTELIRMAEGAPDEAVSLPVGVRALTEAHRADRPLDAAGVAALDAAVDAALAEAPVPADALVVLGGTAATLGAMHLALRVFEPARVHGLKVHRDAVADLYGRLATATPAARRRLPGLPAERADVMAAGCALVLGLLRACGLDEAIVCARGLRHGVFLDRFGGGDVPPRR